MSEEKTKVRVIKKSQNPVTPAPAAAPAAPAAAPAKCYAPSCSGKGCIRKNAADICCPPC